jgi:hypothetical protein
MVTKNKNAYGQSGLARGFVVPYVLLAIILIAAVVAFIATSGNSSKPQAAPEQNKLNADTIVQSGVDLRDASMRFGMDRDITTMTLTQTTGTGLYDPTLALITAPVVPAAAEAAASAGAFSLDKTNITVTGLGTGAAAIAVEATDLTPGVCSAINNVVNGDISGVIPATVGSRQEGCAALTTPTGNTYYKVIQVE